MTGVILQGEALKVVNKGGGYPTKTVVENVEVKPGVFKRAHKHFRSRVRVKGTDYIIFVCPGCGKRNNRSAYEVKGASGQSLAFKCNGCYREIEVARPQTTPIILDPNSPATSKSGLVGPDGRPLS